MSFPENKFDLNSPGGSDFSSTFAKGTDDILASTLLVNKSIQIIDTEKPQMEGVNSQIFKIETMISSFVQNVGQ